MNDNLKPDEIELINAYVDGELAADDRRRLEVQLVDRPDLQAAVTELESLRALFKKMPKRMLSAEFAERVLISAERQMLLGSKQEEIRPLTDVTQWDRAKWLGKGRWWIVVAVAASIVGLFLIPTWLNEVEIAKVPPLAKQDARGDVSQLPSQSAAPMSAERFEGAAKSVMSEESDRNQPLSSAFKLRDSVSRAPQENQAGLGGADAAMDAQESDDAFRSAGRREAAGASRTSPSNQPARRRRDEDGPALKLAEPKAEPEIDADLLVEVQIPVSTELATKKEMEVRGDGQQLSAEDHAVVDAIRTTEQVSDLGIESQGRLVAVETTVAGAGEILAELEQSGATLRDHPMTAEFSQQLATELLASQSVTADRDKEAPTFEKGAAEDNRSLVEEQLEQISKAQVRFGALADARDGSDRSGNAVLLNRKIPEDLQRRSQLQGVSSQVETNQFANQWLSDAMHQAKLRQTDRKRVQSDAQQKVEATQQIRLYLWVREIPSTPKE